MQERAIDTSLQRETLEVLYGKAGAEAFEKFTATTEPLPLIRDKLIAKVTDPNTPGIDVAACLTAYTYRVQNDCRESYSKELELPTFLRKRYKI